MDKRSNKHKLVEKETLTSKTAITLVVENKKQVEQEVLDRKIAIATEGLLQTGSASWY
jgi:hypothetical protein